MTIANARSRQGSAQLYSMRELNQRTADVIREINESGVPAVITRHGRFVAMITPLANTDVESAALGAVIEATENMTQLTGERSAARLRRVDDLDNER